MKPFSKIGNNTRDGAQFNGAFLHFKALPLPFAAAISHSPDLLSRKLVAARFASRRKTLHARPWYQSGTKLLLCEDSRS